MGTFFAGGIGRAPRLGTVKGKFGRVYAPSAVLAALLVLSAPNLPAPDRQQPFGTISGVVRAEGKDAPAQDGGGKYDSRKFKFAERINYAELRDFVVYRSADGVEAGSNDPDDQPKRRGNLPKY